VYVNGHPDGLLVEAPAGLLDADDPDTAVRRETAEEVGVQVDELSHVLLQWAALHGPFAATSATNVTANVTAMDT
jgi:8-oxo-dGTP pyrophosphatase MutT (NUDIX family)